MSLFGDCPSAVAPRFPFDGRFGECSRDTLAVAFEEHAGVVVNVALADEQLCVALAREEHGDCCESVVSYPVVYGLVLIMCLVRGVERVTGLEMCCKSVGGEHCEIFVLYGNLALDVCNETVGNGIVHYSHFNLVRAEVDCCLCVVALDF